MKSLIRQMKKSNLSGTIIAILLASLALAIYSPYFLEASNFINISNQIAVNIIIAIGMTILVTSGGIDLSVGSNVALTGVLIALYFRSAPNGGNPIVGILIGISCGIVLGLINGAIVSLLKAPPFIATLGTMSVFRGFALILSGGRPLMGINEEFVGYFCGFIGTIPIQFVIALIIVFIGYVILNYTKIGRYAQSIGGNEKAVKISGLPIIRIKLLLYVITGALTSIAAMVLTCMMEVAEPTAGVLYEMDAIAIVVMGGTLMEGGKGSIIGTLLGAVLLGIVRNGLNIIGVSANYQQLFIGLIIMTAVVFGNQNHKEN